jgi:hypothetical protein
MKKVFMIFAAATMFAACQKTPDVSELLGEESTEITKDENGLVQEQKGVTKKFTFTLKGDFSTEWKSVTRTVGYLAADGKDMTDVWVLDYQGGTLVQQLHQNDVTAEDFGKPVLNLAYGSHHIYIIASRSTGVTLDTENHIIRFAKVLDTFYKDYTVDVVSTSNGNRAVTLDRIVTRLRLTFDDAISPSAATINFAPHTWYYGYDYIAGTPADSKTDQVVSVTIPESEKGKTGVQANLFGFSTATQWTTDIAINSKKSDNTVIGSATILTAPFKANRISEYAGPLFGSDGAMTLSLSGSWDDAYNGTW